MWHIEALVTRDGVARWVLIGTDHNWKQAALAADRYRATGKFERVRVIEVKG